MYKNKKQWGQKRSPCCPPKMSVRNRRKKSCVRPTECHCLSACCFCARSYIDVTSYQSKAGQFHLNSIKWSLSYMYLQYKHFIQGQNVFHEKLIKKKCVHRCANIDHYLHQWGKRKSILGGRNKDWWLIADRSWEECFMWSGYLLLNIFLTLSLCNSLFLSLCAWYNIRG